MTVASLFSDMILIGVFMLAGFFVREIVKPIQKLFLPASLIGGLLALILGQQMLGLVEIPESFSKFSNVLIAPIMAALLFGVTINKKKVVGYMDYICVEQGIYGMQMCVGAGLGALLAVIWPGLPKGWGTMGVFAFQGGHGNAGAAGQTYEPRYSGKHVHRYGTCNLRSDHGYVSRYDRCKHRCQKRLDKVRKRCTETA